MDQKSAALRARREFQERLKRGLVTRPVYQSCAYCHKDISSDMDWACGYCGYANRRTSLYSIFYKCQKCDREPKSYVCPHCEKITALDVDDDHSHPARYAPKTAKASKPEKRDPPEDSRLQRRREHEEKIEELEQKIERTELEKKLAALEKPSEDDPALAAREKMRRRIKARLGQVIDMRLAIKECRTELAAEFKDDPEMLTDLNDALTWIYENELK
jgi:hypothetical protein